MTVAETPLPVGQISVAIFVQVCEGMNVNVLFPFLAFMIEDFGYTGHRLGYYAGMLAAAFCGAQFCSSVFWGMISDRFGRKPAVIAGVVGGGLGMLVFGSAKTFTQAMIGRLSAGFLTGNVGIIKCFLSEITDSSNRGRGFSLMSVAYSIGNILGPLIGGYLASPAEKYPYVFTNTIFDTYPYLLPCTICFSLDMAAAVLAYAVMIETRKPEHTKNHQSSSVEMTSKSNVSYSKLDTDDICDPPPSPDMISHDIENHAKNTQTAKKNAVWTNRNVILTTSSYGLLAMAYILFDEALPLLLKHDKANGGMSFNSSEIGTVLSCAAIMLLLFSAFIQPTLARGSKLQLFRVFNIVAMPVFLIVPTIAFVYHGLHASAVSSKAFLWTSLIITVFVKNAVGTLTFTGIIIMVNHSVYDRDLGAVNGLGQSMSSLARSVGPALGGALWSLSVKFDFIFLNFITAVGILILCQIFGRFLPVSLDYSREEYDTLKLECKGVCDLADGDDEDIVDL